MTDLLTQLGGPGPSVNAREVLETAELRRIRDLPRRVWQDDPELDLLVALLTRHLKTPGGEQTLLPAQAVALQELYDYGGLLAPIPVGGGKTLISLLAPRVMKAKRPVLLVPASLRDKTRREAREYGRHWKIAAIAIVSYESLSTKNWHDYLERRQPDLLIADECHRLKNTKAACTRRVSRYVRQYGPLCAFMSGTMASRSVREYWHLGRWALEDRAPLPRSWQEAQAWSWALDEKVPDNCRLAPGALLTLGDTGGGDPLTKARRAYGERFRTIPGVVTTNDDRPPMSLTLRAQDPRLPSVVADALVRMRSTWETPDGHPFETALDLWRHSRELACGFYYKWDPRPPREWLEARKQWSRFVRDVLSRSRKLDTMAQVAQAVTEGRLEDGGIYAEWKQIEPAFTPNNVPVWIDDTALGFASQWLRERKGICWVEHRAVGHRLQDMTKIPFFHDHAQDDSGVSIDQHRGPAIASIHTCHQGVNLQDRHWRALYLSAPTKGDRMEQSLGRIHRYGQPKDEVEVDVVVACLEQYESFQQCRLDAHFVQGTSGQPQKLVYAQYDFPSPDEIRARSGPLWER